MPKTVFELGTRSLQTTDIFYVQSSDGVSDGKATLTALANLIVGEIGTMAAQDADSVAITGGTITGITDLAIADGGTGASDANTARTNLGVAIGTDVQAFDALLQSISALGANADKYIFLAGGNVASEGSITAFGRSLIDDTDANTARATLDVYSTGQTDTVAQGVVDSHAALTSTVHGITTFGTNFTTATTASGVRDAIELGTSDSPTFTGLTLSSLTGVGGSGDSLVVVDSTAGTLVHVSSQSLMKSIIGVGSLADQNDNNVAITGGTINGTVIGGTTPAAGAFTTIAGSSLSIDQGIAPAGGAAGIAHTATWNEGADVFTAWELSITDTASMAGSKLVDLKVNAASVFSVDKAGNVAVGGDVDINGGTIDGTVIGGTTPAAITGTTLTATSTITATAAGGMVLRTAGRADAAIDVQGSAGVAHLTIYAPNTNYAAFATASRYVFGSLTEVNSSYTLQVAGGVYANALCEIAVNSADPFNTIETGLTITNGGGNQGGGSRILLQTGAAAASVYSLIQGPNSASGASLGIGVTASGTTTTTQVAVFSSSALTLASGVSLSSAGSTVTVADGMSISGSVYAGTALATDALVAVGVTGNRGLLLQNNSGSAEDFGFKWQSATELALVGGNAAANPTTVLCKWSTSVFDLSVPLKVSNAAVAATPTPTHTITIQDSTGTTYRIPCVV